MSASGKKMWTRFAKRGNLPGGRGREGTTVPSGSDAALLLRLRRLEKVVLHLAGVRLITSEAAERLLTSIKLDASVVGTSAGSSDQREALLLSLQGNPDGQSEGDT